MVYLARLLLSRAAYSGLISNRFDFEIDLKAFLRLNLWHGNRHLAYQTTRLLHDGSYPQLPNEVAYFHVLSRLQ